MNPVAWPLLLLASAGTGYTLFAAVAVRRFARATPDRPVPAEPVTLLKPLHGAEPRLADNLSTFLNQDWEAPIEMVAGVQQTDDPAAAVTRTLGKQVRLVVDGTRHGGNAKVSNLVNMAPAASHDLLVLSDSDMAAPYDYLSRIAAALAQPDVGAVTCVYRGRGDAGRWSVLAAAGISYHFLPQLLVGLATGLARPGMGSTLALRRDTLAAIGGFERFADALADDYALGEAVRGLGREVAVPPMLLVHGCAEGSLAAIWRHERRWAATLLRINPVGQLGTIVTYPLPFALALCVTAPGAGIAATVTALLARLWLRREVDRAAGAVTAPAWLLPLRDCLSVAVLLSSPLMRSVDWRGARLAVRGRGRIVSRAAAR